MKSRIYGNFQITVITSHQKNITDTIYSYHLSSSYSNRNIAYKVL